VGDCYGFALPLLMFFGSLTFDILHGIDGFKRGILGRSRKTFQGHTRKETHSGTRCFNCFRQ
jgi:hypothetical protein